MPSTKSFSTNWTLALVNSLYTDPLFSFTTIAAAALLLLVFLTGLEWRRKERLVTIRLMAQCVIVLSLVALALRPGFETPFQKPTAMVLTPGFEKKIVDSLLKVYPKDRVIATNSAVIYPGAEQCSNFRKLASEFDVRFVLGDGFPVHALDLLRHDDFVFLPGEKQGGISQLTVNSSVVNRLSEVSGEISAMRNALLKLAGPSGVEDSVRFMKNGKQSFILRFTPKVVGRFVYHLEFNEGVNVYTEEIPVEVKPFQKLNILFLQYSPDAEMKFLKNFLIESGHSLTIRSQVSRDQYVTEFANRENEKIDVLTPSVLERYDLLLTNAGTLIKLNQKAKDNIHEACRQGLGLLVLFAGMDSDALTSGLLGLEKDRGAADTIRFDIPGHGSFTRPYSAFKISDDGGIQKDISRDGRCFSGYAQLGKGRIGFQFLRETYRLSLEGKRQAYAALWSALLESVSRDEEKNLTLDFTTAFPVYENEPIYFRVISSGEIPRLSLDGINVPLAEDAQLDDIWYGKIWAGVHGWHNLAATDSSVFSFFVSKNDSWPSLRAAVQRINNSNHKAIGRTDELISVRKPVSPVFFFLLFLIAAGYLWLSPKL